MALSNDFESVKSFYFKTTLANILMGRKTRIMKHGKT